MQRYFSKVVYLKLHIKEFYHTILYTVSGTRYNLSSVLLAVKIDLPFCLDNFNDMTSSPQKWTTQLTGLKLRPEINKQIFNVACSFPHVLLAAATIFFPSDSHEEKSKHICFISKAAVGV